MKIFLKIILALIVIPLSLGLIILTFLYSSITYENNQDNYFSKSSYTLTGKIIDSKHLGGVSYLMKIQVETMDLHRNELGQFDDFAGIYDRESNTAYMVNDVDNSLLEKELKKFPDIKIYSADRKVKYFINDHVVIEGTLATASVYKRQLTKIEKRLKGSVRF